MKNILKKFIYLVKFLIYFSTIPFIVLYLIFTPKKNKKVIWGPTPMINYKYWSESLKEIGYDSETVVNGVYNIHNKSDFDIYCEDLIPKYLKFNKNKLCPIVIFIYIIKNAKVLHTSFDGGPLGKTPIWFFEPYLYRLFQVKTIVMGYGADFFMYSKIEDLSVRHAIQCSYPEASKNEKSIEKNVFFWVKNADIIMGGIQLDGLGRWDCLPVNPLAFKNKILALKSIKASSEIVIVHSPNHQGFKGTEFIIHAINELIEEGFKIKFILLENIKNEKVLQILANECDILIEQVIYQGYGLNAIEGMANGVPVLSNLNNDAYLNVFRRYSYLNECPILSTTPETLKNNLRLLIANKDLRLELGKLGIEYTKKYHSYKSSQYLYKSVLNKLDGENIDLMNLFHPLKSEYVQKNYIKTPLVNNRYIQES